MDLQIHCNNFDQWLGAIIWSFVGMFFQESPAKKAGGTRTLVPFHDDQQVFVLISRIGFRNINFSFFLSVFMCSGHFLVLSEHCQHKCECTIKKTLKKNVGAPEFWCPGTRTLVPPMFLTAKNSLFRRTRIWVSRLWEELYAKRVAPCQLLGYPENFWV